MRKILTFILILCTVALFAEMRGGALYDPGAMRTGNTALAATGTAAAPAYSFSSDPNTGMYSPAADTLAFATAGLLRATILNESNLRFYSTDNTELRGISFGTSGSATEFGSVKMRLSDGNLTYNAGYANWGGRHVFNASGAEVLRMNPTGEVLIATSTDAGDYKLQVSGNVYVTNDVSALSFTDRTPAPENLAESYAIVQSHEVKGKMLDHSKLHSAAWGTKTRVNTTGRMMKRKLDDGAEVIEPETETISEPDPDGRNLSITITAQALVIKDLIKRIEALEGK